MNIALHRVWPVNRIRVGEGERVAVFTLHAFVLLVIYYLLKTMREPLLLEAGSAELKSYAYAAIALVLLLLLPLYGVAFRRMEPRALLGWISGLFAIGLIAFAVAGRAGLDVGFGYYVWVGVLGIFILTQLWAHAAHVFGVERGQRLFPVIMVGAVLGGLAGPLLYESLSRSLEPWGLMLVTTGLLAATLPLIARMRPFPNHAEAPLVPQRSSNPLGGLTRVLRDHYLLLLAVMALLLNCVNTTGEYMLADFVLRHADEQLGTNSSIDREAFIGSFYADYYLGINILTAVLQVLIVGKLLRWIGVSGALLVLPAIALVGYGLIAFVPVFAMVRAVKVLENGVDYSLMNTARHALYLPLPFDQKFEGKTVIDTLFYRLGDLVQAGVVFAGLHWAGFELRDFALFNMALVLVWLLIAVRLGRRYTRQADPGFRVNWRSFGVGLATTAVACITIVLPARAAAEESPAPGSLVEDHRPLEIEFRMDTNVLTEIGELPACRRTGA